MSRRKRRTVKTGSATSTQTTLPPKPRPRPSSRLRAVLFRLVAVLSPLLVLGVINLVLYWCDTGYDTRVVVPVLSTGDSHTFCLNEYASQAYYDERDLAGPDSRPFQLPRPAQTYRIVVVGESSVAGFPYYPELAFPRQIEIFLRRQLPDRQVEVLNAGIVGINSFALVDFVPRMLACQPDLVVLYTGHNEFYGPGGVGSSATLSPWLYPVQTHLRRWRLYQWLHQALRADDPQRALVATLPRDMEIALDGPACQDAERYFRDHLVQVAQAVERSKIPLLCCSVASNLSDQSPVRSISDPRLSAQQISERDALLKAGEAKLQVRDHAAALQLLDKAAAIDDGHALVAYRRAECLAEAGKRAQALALYRRARDLDGCRFRAPDSFREIIRQVAADDRRTSCHYLDLDDTLATLSQRAAPGRDFFFEHVHFTFDGHREIARAIAQSIVRQVLGQEWNQDLVPTPEEVRRATGLTTFDQLMALGYVLKIVQEAPFGTAPDAQRQLAVLAEEFKSHMLSLPDSDRVMFGELGDELRRLDMINGMAARVLSHGEIERALALFRTAQLRRPWEITAYVGTAKCLFALGHRGEARAQIEQALKLAPFDPDLRQIFSDLSAAEPGGTEPDVPAAAGSHP